MPIKPVFKLRGLLVLPPVIFAALWFRGETENDTLTWVVGGLMFLAAVALRVWAQCHLHYRLDVHKTLTTTGPYRHTRNPIYIANTVLLASLVWLMELPWMVLPTALWCAVVYSGVVRYEEKRLFVNFGESYLRFKQAVPRWFRWRAVRVGLAPSVRRFLAPALRAEAHCFLFLLLPVAKEMAT